MMERLKSFREFLLLLTISCIVYFPLIGKKASNPDAHLTYPALYEIDSPAEYIRMLAGFRTVDFQPVRDLTFFWDFAVYRWSGVVTFATTNIVLWALTCFLILRLLEDTVPKERRKYLFLCSLAFCAYPLFSQIVPWGMARKHLTAVPLILSCTLCFLNWMKTRRGAGLFVVTYLLSVLSHPIGVLWPLWAGAHIFMIDRERLKESRMLFIVLAALMAALLVLNYSYYTTLNENVKEVFTSVRPDLSVGRLIMNFFFYLRQLVLPYLLTFQNFPDVLTSLPGVLVLILIVAFGWKEREDRRLVSWLMFALMPFPIFLTLPGVFDQYLLLPAVGVTLALSGRFYRPEKAALAGLVALTVFWGSLTFNHAQGWQNQRGLAERNFSNSPSCKSAGDVLSQYYSDGFRAPVEPLSFFIKSHCFNISADMPPLQRIRLAYLESMMLFYEKDYFPDHVKSERLKRLGLFHFYPRLVHAALLSQLDRREEVEAEAEAVLKLTPGMKLDNDHIIRNVLRPYCLKNQLSACIRVTEPYESRYPFL